MHKLKACSLFRGDDRSKVQLYLDASTDSAEALKVMLASGRAFWALYKGLDFMGSNFALPTLFSLSGTFRGLAEIAIFARSKLE